VIQGGGWIAAALVHGLPAAVDRQATQAVKVEPCVQNPVSSSSTYGIWTGQVNCAARCLGDAV
jgi:hypothetical protein